MTSPTRPKRRTSLAIASAMTVAVVLSGSAFAAPIAITANPAGPLDSHINVNGTNWGGTTFFDVANLPIAGLGTFTHTKNDNGQALGVATVEVSAPDADSLLFDVRKSGFANVAGGGAWSNVQGAVYFEVETAAEFTAAHQVLAGSQTRYRFSIGKYNTVSGVFDLVFGTLDASQTGAFDFAPQNGSLDSGIYEFYWASRNDGPFVGGSSFAHDFQLRVDAEPLPEPATALLLGAGFAALAVARRRRVDGDGPGSA